MRLKILPRILAISALMGMSVLAHADQALKELEGYVIDNAQAIVDAGEARTALQRELQQLREEKQDLKAMVEQLVTRLEKLTQNLEQSTALTKAYADTKASQAEQAAKAHANTKASQAEHAAKEHANAKASQAERAAKAHANTKARQAERAAKAHANAKATTAANTWPPGGYCILRRGSSCPAGFSEGFLHFDTEDDDSANSWRGTLPSGKYGKNNIDLYFCCK